MITTTKSLALTVPFAILFLIAAQPHIQAQDTAKNADKFSPTGTWNWERKSDDSSIKCKLVVSKKKDGTFTGKYEDKEHKLEVKNAKLEDGNFSFDLHPHADNAKMVVQFKGKLSADSIKGKMSYALGDEKKSIDWLAKRFDPMGAAVGKWSLEFETPDGQELEFVINVKKKGDGLTLAFVDDDTSKISKIKFKKNVLSFDSYQIYQEQPINVEWDLVLKGNQLDGTLYFAFENSEDEGEIEVSGSRLK